MSVIILPNERPSREPKPFGPGLYYCYTPPFACSAAVSEQAANMRVAELRESCGMPAAILNLRYQP